MKFRKLLFLVFMLLFLNSSSFAQISEVVLSGFVTDELGSVIPGAKVFATNKTGNPFPVLTSSDGGFELKLAKGLYKIEVIKFPFKTFLVAEYLVGGSNMRFDVALQCKDCQIIEHFANDENIILETKTSKVSNQIIAKPLIELPKINILLKQKKGNNK